MTAVVDGAEASGGEDTAVPPGRASLQGGSGAASAAETAKRRRPGQDTQEVVDELAQETRRTSLLDRVEQQLRDQQHVSRTLLGFNINDDRKVQSSLEQEFTSWRAKQEGKEQLTGVVLYMSQVALHFLEGPTELLFKAIEFFESLAQDDAATSRVALISGVRMLHFTELHGVRTSAGWCACAHPGKAVGGNQIQIEEGNAPDLAFSAYKKMMLLCLQVQDAASADSKSDQLQAAYRKAPEMMPTVDEVLILMGKLAAEYFFTYAEFEKVFVAPFHLKLHSELLWPMPPDLAY